MRDTIRELLHGYEDEVRALLYQTRELRDYALRQWERPELRQRAVVEAHTKLRAILAKVDELLATARDGGRPTQAVEALRQEIAAIQQELLAKL